MVMAVDQPAPRSRWQICSHHVLVAARSSQPQERKRRCGREAVGSSSGGEEMPWMKRTVSSCDCIGGEEEAPWVKWTSGGCDEEERMRARMRVEEEVPPGRQRGL